MKMEKIIEIISLCKASVNITINSHKDGYKTVEEYITEHSWLDDELMEDIGEDVYKEMVERDSVIEIQVYPQTPVGSYKVYHYDLEKAVDIMLEILK